ncbi:cytochrome c biogenesis protein CcdA [Streptosporangium becharense]|uniref:Cytochrome c biogenesis protein CcdA n=1 Tax=Streptosporangium becharense TaxID=1816182 RepID=A0A7W9IA72_9ACTN|nr:cytochrome c biogenesis CcdA family protein [Streptosporangium becharense]MBB2915325.1 cytochrome c biogenesis protein CcdA [Streptosporangium becharense]MBB5816977.1 cytochrome c biogenesis protein CcdA [Streptosporangium becharense]
MSDLGYLTAFLGGVFALFSPCSALLLPSFFAYSFTSPQRLFGRTALLYGGLALTLVPLGVASSAVGALLYGHRDTVVAVGGWSIIALGVAQILGLGFAVRPARPAGRLRPDSALSIVALGAVYGLAGFCAGPILGGILTVAALGGAPVYGGVLLAVYAFGMVVPLFGLALLWDRFDLGRRRWLRGRPFSLGPLRLHTNSLLSGAFFIAIGTVFLVFDGTSALPGLLSVDQEYAAERWIRRLGAAVPDAALLSAVVIVIVAVLLVRHRRRTRRDTP